MTVEDEFEISEEERERLVAEGVEDFSVEFPKYTTQLLNPANRFAQSTRDGDGVWMYGIAGRGRPSCRNGTKSDWMWAAAL